MDLQAPELHQLSGRSVTENGKNCDAILGSKKTQLSSLAWPLSHHIILPKEGMIVTEELTD